MAVGGTSVPASPAAAGHGSGSALIGGHHLQRPTTNTPHCQLYRSARMETSRGPVVAAAMVAQFPLRRVLFGGWRLARDMHMHVRLVPCGLECRMVHMVVLVSPWAVLLVFPSSFSSKHSHVSYRLSYVFPICLSFFSYLRTTSFAVVINPPPNHFLCSPGILLLHWRRAFC